MRTARKGLCASRLYVFLPLVGPAPDFHALRLTDQVLPEVRVGNGDDLLGTLPSGGTFQIHRTVFRNDEMRLRYLSKAFTYDNTNGEALYNLGNAYRKAGDTANAIATYQHLVAEDEKFTK